MSDDGYEPDPQRALAQAKRRYRRAFWAWVLALSIRNVGFGIAVGGFFSVILGSPEALILIIGGIIAGGMAWPTTRELERNLNRARAEVLVISMPVGGIPESGEK